MAYEDFINYASIVESGLELDSNFRLRGNDSSLWLKTGNDSLTVYFLLPVELSWDVTIILENDGLLVVSVYSLHNTRVYGAQTYLVPVETNHRFLDF